MCLFTYDLDSSVIIEIFSRTSTAVSYRGDVSLSSKGGGFLVETFLEHAIPMAIVAQHATVDFRDSLGPLC